MKKPHGFTLLELLVVMVILGALVTIGLRSFLLSQMRARDSKRKGDLAQLVSALELYRTDKGHYPVHDSEGRIVAYVDEDASVFNWGQVFDDPAQGTTIYMGNLPQDPSGLKYVYQAYDRAGDIIDPNLDPALRLTEAYAFRIFAYLENVQDRDRVVIDGGPSCAVSGEGMPCNYYVSTLNLSELP